MFYHTTILPRYKEAVIKLACIQALYKEEYQAITKSPSPENLGHSCA